MANKPSKGQAKLLALIINKKRLPTYTEMVNIYTECALQKQAWCYKSIGNIRVTDKPLYTIEAQAKSWYPSAIGALILSNKLNIKFEEN